MAPAAARIEPPAAGRAPGSREVARRAIAPRGEPVTARMSRTAPTNLEDALLGMSAEEALRAVEEIQGPFEGAHYVLQRGSEVVFDDASATALEGELSVVDCRFVDPEDPGRGRSLWIGGLRTSEPGLFEGRIETRESVDVLGREVWISGRWSDLSESQGRLGGLSRSLEIEIEEASRDLVILWRSEVRLAPQPPSEARFDADDAPCPSELTLHLAMEERLERWEPVLRDGEWHPARMASDVSATPARATLLARRVAHRAELFDPGQRTLRAVALRPGGPRTLPLERDRPVPGPVPQPVAQPVAR